jgi:hypothetical protein
MQHVPQKSALDGWNEIMNDTKKHIIWATAFTAIAYIVCLMVVGSVKSCNQLEGEYIKAGFVYVPANSQGHWEKVRE